MKHLVAILDELERRQPMILQMHDFEGNLINEVPWPAGCLPDGFEFTMDISAMSGGAE